ncbi:MAG: dipicolinate synthase subunit DpsA [Clostridia bacterium]|nr:dipicolinate synthase subunit DpsA [Clostridia bacterium]
MKNLLIIGGDSRLMYLKTAMERDGFNVNVFDGTAPLKSALDASEAVILGLPASRDDKTVDAPSLKEPVLIKDLFRMMGSTKLLLAGKMSPSMKAVADVFSVRWVDYFAHEDFEMLNAVPTCEGALQLAMEELPITLHGANALVIGYGRIGSLLARDLYFLGSKTKVVARRAQSRARANAESIEAFDFSKLGELAASADVIFNTVPQCVMGRDVLANVKHALIIDLASKPGGVDMEAARDFGVPVIWALGLPGKVAPVTAGEIIKKTICTILNEI